MTLLFRGGLVVARVTAFSVAWEQEILGDEGFDDIEEHSKQQ